MGYELYRFVSWITHLINSSEGLLRDTRSCLIILKQMPLRLKTGSSNASDSHQSKTTIVGFWIDDESYFWSPSFGFLSIFVSSSFGLLNLNRFKVLAGASSEYLSTSSGYLDTWACVQYFLVSLSYFSLDLSLLWLHFFISCWPQCRSTVELHS